MAMQATSEATFSIGDVASMTFSVIGRNFIPFAILSLIAAVPQALSLHYLSNFNGPDGRVSPAVIFSAGYWGAWLLTTLLSIVVQYVLQATLTYSTFMDLTKKPISIPQALMTGLNVFFPLVAIGILAGLGTGVGFILLLVPGIMLATSWLVVVPAYVVEKPGIFEAFSRSAALTKGHRWAIFGLMLIFGFAVLLINLGVRPLLGLSLFSNSQNIPIGFLAFNAVLQAVTLVISATGTAVAYYLLRTGKEGVGPAELAAVFE